MYTYLSLWIFTSFVWFQDLLKDHLHTFPTGRLFFLNCQVFNGISSLESCKGKCILTGLSFFVFHPFGMIWNLKQKLFTWQVTSHQSVGEPVQMLVAVSCLRPGSEHLRGHRVFHGSLWGMDPQCWDSSIYPFERWHGQKTWAVKEVEFHYNLLDSSCWMLLVQFLVERYGFYEAPSCWSNS